MRCRALNQALWGAGINVLLAAMFFTGCASPYIRDTDAGYHLAETESKKVYAKGPSKSAKWQPTEYELKPGDIVQVKASGRWTPGKRVVGPEGDKKGTLIRAVFPPFWILKLLEPMGSANTCALIAKLPNGKKIVVENECTIDNTDGSLSGPIAFAANSSNNDANGAVNVELEVFRQGEGRSELIAHRDTDAIPVKPRNGQTVSEETQKPAREAEPVVIASREPDRTERRQAEPERTQPAVRQEESAIPMGNGSNWAVVIGISDYETTDESMGSLAYADEDARDFANLLLAKGWNDSRIKMLLNKDASKRNIEIALKHWLLKAKPEDVIVLFWSGHGIPDPVDPKALYLACYDTDYKIPTTGYRMDEVRQALEERGAKNVVMLADTCYAGGLISGSKGLAVRSNYNDSWKAQTTSVPKGWIFMGGADADRKGIENSIWSNGAFTHCLLDGLNGKADGYLSSGLEDGTVTMNELRTYISNTMPEETAKVLNVPLHPIISASTGDPRIWDLTLQTK